MSEISHPLADELRRLIAIAGPMPVAEFMQHCLTHPRHGYYTTRDPFGRAGDFTTAPEISQVFGELLGIWAGAVWQQMGAPRPVRLVELGPGRGTMMLDMLRAAQVVRGFRDALAVHLVELSPVLERRQHQTLAKVGVPLAWHARFEDVPEGPMILFANEFFDALPVHQAVKQTSGWHERCIGLDAQGCFAFTLAPAPLPRFEVLLPEALRAAPPGSIFEWRSDRPVLEIARRLLQQGGAALIIDYGHAAPGLGDTLQAVAGHGYADPLTRPGESDLTAHVDFAALAAAAESIGATAYGPIEQAEFLLRLGIEARAARLKARAGEDQAAAIEAAIRRLLNRERDGMGRLFKVIALATPTLSALPGFEPSADAQAVA